MFIRKIITLAAVPAVALAGAAAFAGPASATSTSTWTATTSMTNRPDSSYSTQPGGGSDWAIDTFTRTATLTNNGPVSGEPGVYSYTLSLSDGGSYLSDVGANSPNVGTPIVHGQQSGPMSGAGDFTFYVNAASPTSSPPASMDGTGTPSYQWPTLFFPTQTITYVGSDTSLSPLGQYGDESYYSYTYKDAFSCEQWVDASNVTPVTAGGDITGQGHCAVTVADPGSQFTQVNTAATPVDISASTTSSGKVSNYVATGLPAGLVINATTGVISGTPTAVENTDIVKVTATDTAGDSGSTSFGWNVTATPPAPAADHVRVRYACGTSTRRFAWRVTLTGGSNAIENQVSRINSHWAWDGSHGQIANTTDRIVTHAGHGLGIFYDSDGSRPAPHEVGALFASALAPRVLHACP